MKVKYDKEVDIVYIKFTDLPVKDSDEDKPGSYLIMQKMVLLFQ